MVVIHILNLEAKIVMGDNMRLSACHVRKKDENSIINIEGENYDTAILLDLPAMQQVADIEQRALEDVLDECIEHELTHELVPEWTHGYEPCAFEDISST